MPSQAPTPTPTENKSVAASKGPAAGLTGVVLFVGALLCTAAAGAHAAGIINLPGVPGGGRSSPEASSSGGGEPVGLPFDESGGGAQAGANPWLLAAPDTAEDAPSVDEQAEEDGGSTGEDFDPDDPSGEEAGSTSVTTEPGGSQPQSSYPKGDKPSGPASTEKTTSGSPTTKPSSSPTTKPPTTKAPPTTTTTTTTASKPTLASLRAQLEEDQAAVHDAANVEIAWLEAELQAETDAFYATITELEEARDDAKEPLLAELEITSDPNRAAVLEAELLAIEEQFEDDRDAAFAEADANIRSLRNRIAAVRQERDAELARLQAAFEDAAAAL